MNFFPLCTAMVCPTISGITVERRDHVLMTFFSLAWFIASSFWSSGVSTNGPFLSALLISSRLSAGGGRLAAGERWFVCLLPAAASYLVLLCTMNRSVCLRRRVLYPFV